MLHARKYAALIISLCLCFTMLCGCGNTESSKDLMSDAETTAQINQDETPETSVSDNNDSETSEDSVTEYSDINATDNQIIISVNGQELTATLAQNSSVEALRELLEEGPLTISMRDYGSMEKVGDIGTSLPTNDEQITTEAGDLILYMGSAFVIYYAPNSWNFTRLGKIDDISAQELKSVLGVGNVEVILSLR